MRNTWFILAFTIFCVAPQVTLGQTEDKQPVLKKIFADWKERQGLVKTARYVITGTTEYKDKELPPGNPIRPRRTVLLLDMERKRWRVESSLEIISEDDAKRRKYINRFHTTTFDGTSSQDYFHRDLNHLDQDGPDLSIGKGQLSRGGPFDMHLYPVLFAHGVVITGKDTELRPYELPMSYDPEYFEVRGDGLSFQGRRCMVLRTMPLPNVEPYFDELWIGAGEKSTVQRYVEFSGKSPCNRIDTDWKRTDLGWWPDKWTLTWTVGGKVRRIHRLQVESFEANPRLADGDFTLEAKPGMKVVVADSAAPGPGLNPDLVPSRTYLISPSGSWREVSAKGYTTKEGRVLPAERNRLWIWWTIGGAGVVASITWVYLLLRRRWKGAVVAGN